MNRAKYSSGFLKKEKDDLVKKLLQLEHEKSRNATQTLNQMNIQNFRNHESKFIMKSGYRSDLADKKFQNFVEKKNVQRLIDSSKLVKKIETLETSKLTKRRRSSTFSDVFNETSLPSLASVSSNNFTSKHIFDVYLEDEEDLKSRMKKRERLPSLISAYTNSLKYSLLERHNPTNQKAYKEVIDEAINLQTKFSPKVNIRNKTLEYNGKKFSLSKKTNQTSNMNSKKSTIR